MFARFFIDRPIFAWVLSIVIILVGAVSAFFLPMSLYPPITPPTVTVSAVYPGANAEVVADTIASPIEQQVNGVENMMYMSSQSTNDGTYVLTVTFEIGTDLNMAQVLVQNRVALATPQLPAQVQLQGVEVKKTSPNIMLAVNLISPDGRYDSLYLSNYATVYMQDDLARIKGVGDIKIFGQRNYSMRIWLDPDKMATRGLTAVDVVNAIKAQNVQVAAGQVGQQPVPSGQQLQLPMSALGRLNSVKQFADIILKTDPGNQLQGTTSNAPQEAVSTPVVRVRDVGRVEMGAQNYDQVSHLDGKPAAGIAVFQLPGSNALDVADAVEKRVAELSQRFPPGLEYRIVYNTTPFIRQSVDEVFLTLRDAVLLVALVVLLFLQDWRAMILPMIDVPVSLIGTFAVMTLLGFSLNNLTLFGLVLAIGIVVDDAIVVLENIERLIATGLDARTATIKAMDELTGPIIAITLVLSSVFLPSIFIPGLTGQFYRQFAVTISSAMIISALNALTLTPSRAVSIFRSPSSPTPPPTGGGGAGVGGGHEHKREALPWWIFAIGGGLATLWLGEAYFPGLWGLPEPGAASVPAWQSWGVRAFYFLPGFVVGGVIGWWIIRPVNAVLGWFFGLFNRVFDALTHVYGRTVGMLLRLSLIVLVVFVGLLFLTWWSMERAPTGFIPTQDQGYLLLNVQLPDSASVQRTRKIMARVDRIARSIPGVAHTVSISGQSFLLGINGSNLGSMFVVLQPFSKRRSPDEYDAVIARKLQAECQREIEGAVVGVFRAPPIRGLGNAGGFKLQTEQRGFVNLPELQAKTDELVRRANANPMFAGVFTLFRANTPQLFVNIDRTKVQALQVPMDDVFTTLTVYMGGLYVNQFNKFGRTWQVQVQAEPRFRTNARVLKRLQVRSTQGNMIPLGTLARVENTTGPISFMRYNMYASASVNGMPAPGTSSGQVIAEMTRLAHEVGIPFEWTEMAYLEVQAGNIALLVFALGTVLVYLVLAAQYESWKLPLAVILVVPLCMLAAVTGMFLAHLPVDIFVQIGLLVLVGLASKNAILIVEYARDLSGQGEEPQRAAQDAAHIRFRPILMTSLAFILGVLPLVLASGAGAEMRQSLGIAVFSGMIGVTLFGIFLTPVFFYVLMRMGRLRPVGQTPAPHTADGDGTANVRAPLTVSYYSRGGMHQGREAPARSGEPRASASAENPRPPGTSFSSGG